MYAQEGEKMGLMNKCLGCTTVKDLEAATHEAPTHLFTNALCSVTGTAVSTKQRETT